MKNEQAQHNQEQNVQEQNVQAQNEEAQNDQAQNDQAQNDQAPQFIDMQQLTIEQLKHYYRNSEDVTLVTKYYRPASYGLQSVKYEVILMYSHIMIDHVTYIESVLPGIKSVFQDTGFLSLDRIEHHGDMDWVIIGTNEDSLTISRLTELLFEGNMICFFPHLKGALAINLSGYPTRSPSDSSIETSIRGARDCLVENIHHNVALIRRRISSENLVCENYSLGSITKTKLVLLYMKNIANEDLLSRLHEKINNINVEQLITTGALESKLSKKGFLNFPVVDYSGRPDFIAENLLDGRFVLILDNNPYALIAPGTLFQLIQSPEDSYYPVIATNIGKLFRLFGLIASIFLPAFFVALISIHPDQIPYALLATISVSRKGLPLEAGLEMFFIITFMELFREATLRLPNHLGQSITVVGGLIIGEASIRAGIVSPIMVVIAAITIVASATLVNQTITSTVVLLRFIVLLAGSVFGLYGLILSYIAILMLLSKVNSLGVPYLAPLSPLNLKDALASLFQLPYILLKRRPSYLHTKKPTKED